MLFAVLKEAGCEVHSDSPTVRMDRAFVMEQVEKAPESITLQPRNLDHTLISAPYTHLTLPKKRKV